MDELNKIVSQYRLLSRSEAVGVSRRVKNLNSYCINRGSFSTLGPATYQDDPLAYPTLSNAFNPHIMNSFRGLLQKLASWVSDQGKIPAFLPGTALPSFHVINHRANGGGAA